MLVTSRPRALDADLAAYIQQNLPVGTSYETLLALANAIGYVGQGMGRQLNIDYAKNVVLTDMAAAATLLFASAGSAKKVDLTHYTECRIVCIMGAVAAPAGGKVIAKFKTTLGANDAAYAALGTSAVEAVMTTINAASASEWIPLATAAKADVFVAVSTSGGDGAIDPAVGTLEVQFR